MRPHRKLTSRTTLPALAVSAAGALWFGADSYSMALFAICAWAHLALSLEERCPRASPSSR